MPPRGLCDICRTEVTWLQPKEAAALVGVTPHSILRWVDQGRVHIWEQANDRCLICERSLAPSGKGRVCRKTEEDQGQCQSTRQTTTGSLRESHSGYLSEFHDS